MDDKQYPEYILGMHKQLGNTDGLFLSREHLYPDSRNYDTLLPTIEPEWTLGDAIADVVLEDGVYRREFEHGTIYARIDPYEYWIVMKDA